MFRTLLSRRSPLAASPLFTRAAVRPAPSFALASRPAIALLSTKIPGSDNKHDDSVGKTARDEAKKVASDIAKTIAGNAGAKPAQLPNQPTRGSAQGVGALKDDFVSFTSTIASTVPKPLMVLGLAGGLPYVATSLSTLYYARQAGLASQGLLPIDPAAALSMLTQCTHVQIAYGATMLSFLGAIHWGLEISEYGGQHGYRRLLLGVAPVLYSLPTLVMAPQLALAAQWAGFTGLWFADMKATGAGWAPIWYSQYRFYLSLLVGSCIILTLGGTNYLGPSTIAAPETFSSLKKHREEARAGKGGTVQVSKSKKDLEITADKGDAKSDAYVSLRNLEEEREKEKEEKKKAEERKKGQDKDGDGDGDEKKDDKEESK
ncbi:hypothetical protein BOTBODRAFT_130413 [Botryobasidium botryosum FD-172 SS1]|uniref:Mitochondrial inner membrane protein 1 n=1 Tax=Botryobasidium botryosum (strain FD-172 SS1) TaxID=930990 RepID=A0A067MK49_BOTB1|nr:hypothetical protein BOTBODRAFT_130413 [Botryobasidium botryosum FD-172 SS1]